MCHNLKENKLSARKKQLKKCDICGKEFTRGYHLKGHIKLVHKEGKPNRKSTEMKQKNYKTSKITFIKRKANSDISDRQSSKRAKISSSFSD